MRDPRKVGEILVAAGIIDERQLQAALVEQARWGRRLGVTLIKMGLVEEGHLIRALAKQLDLPVASLAGKRISPEVIAMVPARVASEHGVLPLFAKQEGANQLLYLGMEDPSNIEVLDDLAFRTGMEIHPVMVGPTELGEAIDRYYHHRPQGAPAVDPFRTAETMSAGALRVVTDDTPQPGTVPADPAMARAEAAQRVEDRSGDTSSSDAGPTELEQLIEETERTRIVAKALTQILLEKGRVTLDEIQAGIEKLKAVTTGKR